MTDVPSGRIPKALPDGVSQATVSRRWDLLRPLIGDALAEVVPDPREVVGRGTVLVDGTVCPTWDWRHVPDLFSAKTGYPGMNLQIAASFEWFEELV